MPKHRQKAARAALTPGRRRWFRVLALAGAPALGLLFLEAALRLFGVGYPTAFLLPSSNHGVPTWVQNNQFTWRFFGPQLSQQPFPLTITRQRTPGTVRIFVFGESAAYGDPQPEFGLPRLLEAVLTLRHPETRFEVVSTGITAINSHVVRDIARDCAKADGDIWVIYMGNNEVVGPFGAGTVFGGKTPPLALIRATLALKTTRVGQFLDSARLWFHPESTAAEEWGGMSMFLGFRVRASDPRMARIDDYFARNLPDMISYGRSAGAGIVVSTVAVNLKDCGPFASEHKPNLSGSELDAWNRAWNSGILAQSAGDFATATTNFQEAARLDDTFAELRFRQGQCALARHDLAEAQRQFTAARDLDTLRFRCDGELNDLARQIAGHHAGDRVRLADAERVFAEQSPDGLPGENYFYEHVHLNFDGNYLLARTIGEQVEPLLPRSISGKGWWPSRDDCARRLAWSDRARQEVAQKVAGRLLDPPFTAQCTDEAQTRALNSLLQTLAPAAQPEGIPSAEKACAEALDLAPDDPELHGELALLEAQAGDDAAAVSEETKALDAVPSDAAGWANLGLFLAGEKKFPEAVAALRRARALDPLDIVLTKDLAHALWKAGDGAKAETAYRKAVKAQPGWAMAWLDYGEFLEDAHRPAEASNCFHRALLGRGKSFAEFTALAHFCEARALYEAASTNYLAAIQLAPMSARLRVDAGGDFALWGRNAEAAAQFRQALLLQPSLVKTRINLAVALMKDGHSGEALTELNRVLAQAPGNPLAQKYAAMLRGKLAP